jgi:hypothetical protein
MVCCSTGTQYHTFDGLSTHREHGTANKLKSHAGDGYGGWWNEPKEGQVVERESEDACGEL